jgi:hypothetical protein
LQESEGEKVRAAPERVKKVIFAVPGLMAGDAKAGSANVRAEKCRAEKWRRPRFDHHFSASHFSAFCSLPGYESGFEKRPDTTPRAL